ncbi:MAG: hypothetical protein ACYTGW_00730 [Planctomycetota bacterium]|jgi:hypothetical protein
MPLPYSKHRESTPTLFAGTAMVLALCTVAFAQTVSTNHVIGWVDNGSAKPGEIHIQDIDGGCKTATLLHKALSGSGSFWAGGTAYDPRHEAVWVSDGKTIAEVRLSDGKILCSFKAQLMNTSAVVSGLAIADKGRRLIQLETMASYGALRSYSLTNCPPVPLRDGCTITVPTGHFCGGLAYDEVEQLYYYTVTKPGFQVPQNTLHVADRCKSLCSMSIGGCIHFFGTDVTGLGYDACTKTLYATVGMGTVPITVGNPRKCEFKVGTCCVKQLAAAYKGLAVVPGWTQFRKGTSCITKGCPFCNKLDNRLYGGAPSLGNPDFGVEVVNGPTGALAILGVGLSTCGKGTHFSCGALWLPGNPLIFFPGMLSGSQCQAGLKVPLPVPVDAKLCGQRVCLQWGVICSGASGEGLTPAIEFSITGS